MEQSTLAEILGVERDIRARLDAEHEQASRWLEDARREIEQAHQSRLAQLQADAKQRRDAALQAARDRASRSVASAGAVAANQAAVEGEQLRVLVRHHLAVLVPERAR